jgi:hypothetical protein
MAEEHVQIVFTERSTDYQIVIINAVDADTGLGTLLECIWKCCAYSQTL